MRSAAVAGLVLLCCVLLLADGDGSEGELEKEELDDSGDDEEAFNDPEDEALLCAEYASKTRQKRLPDAIVIGARKVRRRCNHVSCLKHNKSILLRIVLPARVVLSAGVIFYIFSCFFL